MCSLVVIVVLNVFVFVWCVVFFFKQKTAYEMRISDWSSDVCSSDLSIICGRRCACAAPCTSSSVPERERHWCWLALARHRWARAVRCLLHVGAQPTDDALAFIVDVGSGWNKMLAQMPLEPLRHQPVHSAPHCGALRPSPPPDESS